MENNDSIALSIQSGGTTDDMTLHKPCNQLPSIQELDLELSLTEHSLPLLQKVRHLAYLLCAPPDKPSCQHVISIDGNNTNAVTLLIQVLSQYFLNNAGYQVQVFNTLNNLASSAPDDQMRDFIHTLEHWQQQWQVIHQIPCPDSTGHPTACYCCPHGHSLCISIIPVSPLMATLWTLVPPARSPPHALKEQWNYCVKSWTSYV